jgi:hypothetical protein
VGDPFIHWVEGGIGTIPSRHGADETDRAPVLVTESDFHVIADGDLAVEEAIHVAFETAFPANVRGVAI